MSSTTTTQQGRPARRFFPGRCLAAALVTFVLATGLVPAAHAADVPIVGVATGDATRGPLVDYIQALQSVSVRTPGFTLLSPAVTARKVDESATPARPGESLDSNAVNVQLTAAARLSQADDHAAARDALQEALRLVERDGGRRIVLGAQATWIDVRMRMAEAWVLDRPAGRKGKRGEPVEAHLESARVVLRPIFDVMPGFAPESGTFDTETLELVDAVRAEARRTGTLTVRSPAGSVPVYVNGVEIGRTPIDAHRLAIGEVVVESGKPDRPGRIHTVTIGAGTDVALTVDPSFEAGLTTTGYAIVEAPPGQSAQVAAVQIGSGVATLTGNRYAVVFAVEGAQPLFLYAALVDAENAVVVRERQVEVQPGPVETDTLKRLLLYVVEGREIDTSWPASRYVWIASFVASAGLLAGSTAMFVLAEDTIASAEERDQFTSDVVGLEEEAGSQRTIGWVLGGAGVGILGLAIALLVVDMNTETEDPYALWPTLGAAATANGGALSLHWAF